MINGNGIDCAINYSDEFYHRCGDLFYRGSECPACNIVSTYPELSGEEIYKKTYIGNHPKSDIPDYFD